MSNRTSVDAAKGNLPWALNQPSGRFDQNCASLYGHYRDRLGQFDDLGCRECKENAGYICERAAVSCTKKEIGIGLSVQESVSKTSQFKRPMVLIGADQNLQKRGGGTS